MFIEDLCGAMRRFGLKDRRVAVWALIFGGHETIRMDCVSWDIPLSLTCICSADIIRSAVHSLKHEVKGEAVSSQQGLTIIGAGGYLGTVDCGQFWYDSAPDFRQAALWLAATSGAYPGLAIAGIDQMIRLAESTPTNVEKFPWTEWRDAASDALGPNFRAGSVPWLWKMARKYHRPK